MPVLVDATHPLWSIVERLSGSELVKAVALVGSRVGDLAVPDSDYDVFIYTEGDLAHRRDPRTGWLFLLSRVSAAKRDWLDESVSALGERGAAVEPQV